VKKFLDLAWAIGALPWGLGTFGAECQSGRDVFGDVALIMGVGDKRPCQLKELFRSARVDRLKFPVADDLTQRLVTGGAKAVPVLRIAAQMIA